MEKSQKPPSKSQKKRLSKLLSSGEEVIFVTGLSVRYFVIRLFFLLILPLFLFYASFLMFLGIFDIPNYSYLKYLGIIPLILLMINTPKYGRLIRMKQSYTYALTNRRFLIVRGIFARKIVTAPLAAITHVTIEQSFWQRFLFNSGHLVIITAGFDQREIVIENIGDPVNFKILIEDLTEALDHPEEPQDEDTLKTEKDKLNLRGIQP